MQQASQQIKSAIRALQNGEFILVHDSSKRENEVDMIVAAQFITSEHIATMRNCAGGLICACINSDIATNIGLQYMHDVLFSSNVFDEDLKRMVYGIASYGDHPTFSIWINHKNTRTGITDVDRALTIKTIASVCDTPPSIQKELFISTFRTPGHIPLLIAKDGLLRKRQGHTEISVFLTHFAELIPCTAICEMIDSDTHKAMTTDKVRDYSIENNIPFLDVNDVLELL